MQTQLVGCRLQAGAICDTTVDRPSTDQIHGCKWSAVVTALLADVDDGANVNHVAEVCQRVARYLGDNMPCRANYMLTVAVYSTFRRHPTPILSHLFMNHKRLFWPCATD